jgi:hypothetical protein
MKLYTLDKKLLTERPEIRIGEKVYAVDDRLKTFEAMNTELSSDAASNSELKIIIKHALGESAVEEIFSMDLSFAAMQKIVILIMAAMQDITEEVAEKRFRNI